MHTTIELPAHARIPSPPGCGSSQPPSSTQAAPAARLQAVWARHEDEVRAAQRLRWQVFGQEMGATLKPPPGSPAGHDIDLYDRFCEHLIVRTVPTGDHPGEVVGTYRVLTPAGAKLVGGLYTDTEFDLVRLARLRPRMAELGRSCIHPDWRTGGVILLLWSHLVRFMDANGLPFMIGCASVPMPDGGHAAASLWERLRRTHLAPIEQRVTPRLPLPVDDLDRHLDVEPPPLIKGYLQCGARLLGAPAWDPDFGTADLPVMLDLRELPATYKRRFLGR
jgi:putative hemolysin